MHLEKDDAADGRFIASTEIHRIRRNPPFHVARYDERVTGNSGSECYILTSPWV